jgi:hypothetical protein
MRSVFIPLAAVVVASCAVALATPYVPKGTLGGYSEVQLDRNVFRVTFEGNGYISRQHTEEKAHLRSAEVALNSGFKYFVVTDGSLEMRGAVPPVPAQSITPGSVTNTIPTTKGGTATEGLGARYAPGAVFPGFPTVIYTIAGFAERPAGDAPVYDASLIISSLKPKHALSPQ